MVSAALVASAAAHHIACNAGPSPFDQKYDFELLMGYYLKRKLIHSDDQKGEFQ
jgi:hypothetical protein